MKKTKTIRVGEENYKELIAYKAELEIINKQPISFDEAIEMLFNEIAGLEYELGSERVNTLRANRNSKNA